ncbi:hypothetical protein U9M48_025652, partial [Paspalum notatum var. saurae]
GGKVDLAEQSTEVVVHEVHVSETCTLSRQHVVIQIELFQSLELTYGFWDLASEIVLSKIKIQEQSDHAAKGEALQGGGIEQFIWDSPA